MMKSGYAERAHNGISYWVADPEFLRRALAEAQAGLWGYGAIDDNSYEASYAIAKQKCVEAA